MSLTKFTLSKGIVLKDLLTEMLYCLDLNQIKNKYKDMKNNNNLTEEERIAIFELGFKMKKAILCHTEEQNKEVYDMIKQNGDINANKLYLLVNYIIEDFKEYNKIHKENTWTLHFDRIFSQIKIDNSNTKIYEPDLDERQ